MGRLRVKGRRGAKMKVGIPRALAYFSYFPVWESFFREVGAEVVVSNPTNKDILNAGIKEAITDACIPIKLFHGHVANLKGKVDYLFIPRLVHLNNSTTYCPKFLGLPEMIKSSIDDLPPIIDTRVDLRKGRFELFKVSYRIGRMFTRNIWKIFRAYGKAKASFSRFRKLIEKGVFPEEAIKIMNGANEINDLANSDPGRLKIALLGYPYEIYDGFLNLNLIEKLQKMNVSIITADMIPERVLESQKNKVAKGMFWTFSDQALKAAMYFIEEGRVDGMIHITAFGCGPDSMVDRYIDLEIKAKKNIPYMSLMIDEHSAEAGMMTRLEAFIDMLRRRREQNESSIPVSGTYTQTV
jgi:predicted nucleotide-binding protein (sugar kinase/HSP70/actin superfamily)